MMLTPKFELTQNDEFITVIIYAPYTNVANAEFHVEDDVIIFYSKPYYLRLHLPKHILDDERSKATYDADRGSYTAVFAKENKGEVFEGLDMLTKLLTPPEAKWKSELNPGLVEEISSSETNVEQGDPSENAGEQEDKGEEDDEWCIDQTYPTEPESAIFGGAKYGFANRKSGMSQKLMLEFSEIFDVKDLDSASCSKRKEDKFAHEATSFSGDHYLADLYDNEEIGLDEILHFHPWWEQLNDGSILTLEEKEVLLKLPKKNYLLDVEELSVVYLGLIDIIYGYAYNHRTVRGENTVESGWTIAKLAATLSWLDSHSSLKDVVVSCFRRTLTFPLYRSWDLCVKVLADVRTLFAGGKKSLLKCLLDVRTCMIMSDPRFIFNDLYITDYCVWIQSAKSKHIQSVVEALKHIELCKADVGLELEELEFAAALMLEEQQAGTGVEELAQSVSHLNVQTSLDSDDNSDDHDEDREEKENDEEEYEETETEEESEDESEEESESESDDSEETKEEDGKEEMKTVDSKNESDVEQKPGQVLIREVPGNHNAPNETCT